MKGTVSIVVKHIFHTFSVEVIVSSVVAKLSLNDSKMLLCCFVKTLLHLLTSRDTNRSGGVSVSRHVKNKNTKIFQTHAYSTEQTLDPPTIQSQVSVIFYRF